MSAREPPLPQIHRDHGAIDGYLRAAGLTDTGRRRLQAVLLDH